MPGPFLGLHSFTTTPIRPSSLAGDYVFSVYLQEDPDNPRFQVRTRISVEVAGDRSGVPEYAEEPAARGGARTAARTDTADADGSMLSLGAVGVGSVLLLGAASALWILRRRRAA